MWTVNVTPTGKKRKSSRLDVIGTNPKGENFSENVNELIASTEIFSERVLQNVMGAADDSTIMDLCKEIHTDLVEARSIAVEKIAKSYDEQERDIPKPRTWRGARAARPDASAEYEPKAKLPAA